MSTKAKKTAIESWTERDLRKGDGPSQLAGRTVLQTSVERRLSQLSNPTQIRKTMEELCDELGEARV